MKLWPNRMGNSVLARNTLWTLLGQGSRLLIQGACFVLIARSLGAANYGAFVAAVALVAIVAPYATWGFGNLLVQNVARDPEVFAEWWGNGLLMSVMSGAALLGGVAATSRFLMPAKISIGLVLLVASSDLLAARLTDLACLAFQSMERMRWMANINIGFSALRLAAAILSVEIWHHPTASQWALFYCGASFFSAGLSVLIVTGLLGAPRPNFRSMVSGLVDGFHFATGLSAQTIYNDLDKTMLSRFSTLDATGIYAAAYRFIDVAFLPVRSLLWSASPAFFRAGRDGIGATVGYVKRLLPKAVIYGVVVFVALNLSAPLLPRILGMEYARSVGALRWLALIPLIRTIHTFYSDALSGAGYQKVRMMLQVFVAFANFLMNLWVIPAYSWRGAVWSSLASDSLLLVAVVSTTVLLSREAKTKPVVRGYALEPPFE